MVNLNDKLVELLFQVKHSIEISLYHYDSDSWFFPSDVVPHSSNFKRVCAKLYNAGLLERNDAGRWGFSYRILQKEE